MKKILTVCMMLLAVGTLSFATGNSSAVNTLDAVRLPRNPVAHRSQSTLDTVGQALAVITVPVLSPSGVGVSIAADCRGTLYYTNYGTATLYKMDALGNLLGSVNTADASGNAIYIDAMSWDEGRQMLWGGEDNGNHNVYLIDPATGLCTFQFIGSAGFPIDDGIAFDPTDGTIWQSPDVSSSIDHYSATGTLLGSLTPLGPSGCPDGSISGICVGTGNRMYCGHDGAGRISIVDKSSGAWLGDFFSPGGRDEDLECDAISFAPNLVLWSKDAYNNTVTAIQVENGTCACAVLPDTCQFPFQEVDMGDLPPCNYVTFPGNPGHGLSGIAWLGDCISGDVVPNTLDLDACDDGVIFNGLPWTPCTMQSVTVTVTGGRVYDRYEHCGGHLYLNAWKDGNLDGDFCDDLPCDAGVASEWIIQDMLVVPGSYIIPVLDPGVFNLGVYDGVFRFRLTSQPVGRFGYGLTIPGVCQAECPGTYGLDFLGEVEDYIIHDAQLSVELASFNATAGDNSVILQWATASESRNDHFEVVRDGASVAMIATQGNGSAGHNYTWTDNRALNGRTYSYKLVAVDQNGGREELRTASATPSAGAAVVTEYSLHQNYPNPFNPSTEIVYDMKEAGFVSLKVYNLLGQKVATLVNGNVEVGRHTTSFDASGLPSGVYLYRMEANGFSAENKMLLMK